MIRSLMVLLLACIFPSVSPAAPNTGLTNLSLPPNTQAILDHIYSWRLDQAVSEARQLQEQNPTDPLGYLLEEEALWWKIWCASAEFKYGMTMPRHREKNPADQAYLALTAKAY